jgi:hypothetical protein
MPARPLANPSPGWEPGRVLATAGGSGAAGGRPGNTGWGELPGSSASPADGVRVEHRNQRGWGVGVVGEGRRVGQNVHKCWQAAA